MVEDGCERCRETGEETSDCERDSECPPACDTLEDEGEKDFGKKL